MTKERLAYLINVCLHRNGGDEAEHLIAIARFLGVQPITLRRWLAGDRPVPRQVEIIMEVFHFWPEVTAKAVDNLIRAVDEGSKA